MAQILPVLVSEDLLNYLFDAFGVWEKIESGRLSEVPGPEPTVPAAADWCADGASYYTRIENAAGFRTGRIHYLACPGREVLRFPSYLMVAGVRFYRVGHARCSSQGRC